MNPAVTFSVDSRMLSPGLAILNATRPRLLISSWFVFGAPGCLNPPDVPSFGGLYTLGINSFPFHHVGNQPETVQSLLG